MLAIVEFNKNEQGESAFGRTFGLAPHGSDTIRWMDVFARVNANFERYTLTFIKDLHARKLPHSSMYLEMLGIHPDPERRDHPATSCPACGRPTVHP